MTVGAESADPDVPRLTAGSTERLQGRLVRGVLWNIVGTVFNQGSTFVVNLILANLWGLKTFGEYAMVQSTVAVVASMAQFATGYTATKDVAEFRSINPDRTGRVLALCGLVAVSVVGLVVSALVLGADLLAGRMLGEPSLAPIIRISAVAIGFSVLSAFLTGALAGFEQYAAFARAGIIAGLVYVASCSIGAWMAGLAGAVAGQGLSAAIFALVLFRELRQETIRSRVRVRLADAFAELRILLRFALPAALNNLVALPAIWLANATLVRQSRGYEEMALFTAANGFRIIVLFLPNIVNNVRDVLAESSAWRVL